MSRELDAEVAEKVMGFVRHRHGVLLPNDERLSLWYDHAMKAEADRGELFLRVPEYSADIARSMTVVERLMSRGWQVDMTGENDTPRWWVCFDTSDGERVRVGEEGAETLPEAICRAALQATASASALSDQDAVESSLQT